MLIDSSAVKAHRCASGGKQGKQNQAIERFRGGRTAKIHVLTDRFSRVADCKAGKQLLARMRPAALAHGDKGYDSNAIRAIVEAKGALPNIPPKANRVWKNCFSPHLYSNKNAIEPMFGRLKEHRRIATRYDRSATN